MAIFFFLRTENPSEHPILAYKEQRTYGIIQNLAWISRTWAELMDDGSTPQPPFFFWLK